MGMRLPQWYVLPPPTRGFVAASSQYLQIDKAPLTALPISMACWFRTPTTGTEYDLMWVGNGAASTNYWALMMGNPSATVGFICRNTATILSSSAASVVANQWHHAGGTQTSATVRSVYLDGAATVGPVTSSTPGSTSRVSVGMYRDSTPANAMDGQIMLPCVWNVALSDGEFLALANGVMPWQIRPANIVACPDLTTLYDPYLLAQWTNVGTTMAAAKFFAPRLPRRRFAGKIVSAPAGGWLPAWAARRGQLIGAA